MAEDTVYALDSGGNRIATFSAEQILEAINAAITTGEIPSELTAFIDAIKEQNKGKSLKFWLGTQAEFLALENTEEDIIYFINDSTNLKELSDALDQLKEQLQSGAFVVEKANDAGNVTTNINGKAISSIFESDGATVKKATNAATVNGSNLYQHSGKVIFRMDDQSDQAKEGEFDCILYTYEDTLVWNVETFKKYVLRAQAAVPVTCTKLIDDTRVVIKPNSDIKSYYSYFVATGVTVDRSSYSLKVIGTHTEYDIDEKKTVVYIATGTVKSVQPTTWACVKLL